MAFESVHTDYVNASIELPPAADLVAMLDEGASCDDLAAVFDCSASTIRVRITNSGIRQAAAVASTPAAAPGTGDGEAPSGVSPVPTLLGPLTDAEWMDDGLCAQTDPEEFFPEKGGSTRDAKAVCVKCTVAADCLDWALAHNERFGIWGGLSERERRQIAIDLQASA